MPWRGVGAEHDHRRLSQFSVVADLAQHLFTGHVGEVEIQENQVRMMFARQLEAEASLHGWDELKG